MASRRVAETIITRRNSASAAQLSSQQEATIESELYRLPSADQSPKHLRQSSPTVKPAAASSVANFPATDSPATARASSVRPTSSRSATYHPSPSYASPSESYFVPQSTSSGIEARSPATKRPPASRSSHGIETSSGPPPALSTQRTLSTENTWRFPLADNIRPSYPQFTPPALATLDASNGTGQGGHKSGISGVRLTEADNPRSEPARITTGEEREEPGVEASTSTLPTSPNNEVELFVDYDRSGSSTGSSSYKDLDSDNMSAQLDGNAQETKERLSQSSQEDLFFNLARNDEVPDIAADTLSRDERRRSRIGQTTHRTSLSQGTVRPLDARPLSSSANYEGGQYSPAVGERRSSIQRGEQPSYFRPPSSTGRPIYNHRSYAASAHPLESRRTSRRSGSTSKPSLNPPHEMMNQESSPELPSYGRRPSIPESSLGFQSRYRQFNLSHATNSQYHSSPLTARSHMYEQDSTPTPRAEGTESTVSTTAPSTIFDELDDLKSRLRKLELTAKMPISSGAAISGVAVERPPTATTTVTTMSTSPKRGRGMSTSPGESAVNGPVDATMHPNLHSALAQSKSHLSTQVYSALEATASDALSLVKMTTNNGTSGMASSNIDRQLKRKADSMCRSLTELCIALSTDKSTGDVAKAKIRSPSRDTALLRTQRESSVEQHRSQRAMSEDPDESTAARVLSRLEARRKSMLVNGTNHGGSSSVEPQAEPSTPMPVSSSVSGPNRASTVLQRARRVIDDDAERTLRPMSRATAELGLSRPPLRPTTSSNDYISSISKDYNPSPSNQVPRPPTAQSSLPVRRSYLSANSATPPSTHLGTQRYFDRTAPNSADNARLIEARQRRLASMGTYNLAIRQGSDGLGRRLRRPSADQFTLDTQGVD